MAHDPETLKQIELYKNHLEFLGYTIETPPDGRWAFVACGNGPNIFFRIYPHAVEIMFGFSTSEYARKNRLALLEFVNHLNTFLEILKSYTLNDSSAIVFTSRDVNGYEKSRFGGYMNAILEEVDQVREVKGMEKIFG